MADKVCSKCIHNAVCKTAESCDGYVSGCENFATDTNVAYKMKATDKDINVLTNADRIRAMSDAELEKAVGHRSLCYYIQDETNFCNGREVCGDCIREWLKQPADVRGEEDG